MSLPEKILLATDLSARSDRALDRATMLAAREGSELIVLHVLDPALKDGYYSTRHTLPQLAVLARSHILIDLGSCANTATIRIEEGDPAAVIARVAREEACTLIVLGVARLEHFGRFVLGKTVERMLRIAETPLLIVTERPRAPYHRVAVAVDFSKISTKMLALTARLFPEQRLTLFHAYQPIGSFRESRRAQYLAVAETDYKTWLAATGLPAATLSRIDARLELGDPALLIADTAARNEVDLVVLGTRGLRRIFKFFIGSVTKRILERLPCDALFIREFANDTTTLGAST